MNEITGHIIDAAMRVHSALGPGLLESAYETCLAHELRKRGFHVLCQHPVPIHYDGICIDIGYRIDVFVNETVIVELKAASRLTAVYEAQLLSYLRLSHKPVGLLINFHELHLKDGIKRMINT